MNFIKKILLIMLFINPAFADELQTPESITKKIYHLISERKYEEVARLFSTSNIRDSRKVLFDYFGHELKKLEKDDRTVALEAVSLSFHTKTIEEILTMDEHEFLTIIFQQFYDGNPLLGLPTPTISNFQIIETLIPENSSDRKTVRLSYTVKELDTTTGEYQLTYETDFLDFHKSSGKWEPLIPDLKSFLYQ